MFIYAPYPQLPVPNYPALDHPAPAAQAAQALPARHCGAGRGNFDRPEQQNEDQVEQQAVDDQFTLDNESVGAYAILLDQSIV